MANVRSGYTDKINFYGLENPRELAARFGTPLYVYNEAILRRCCADLVGLSAHPGFKVNYSAKANTNPELLKIIREAGCVVDAMSPGELHMNFLAGFAPEQILYVCNNVGADEMRNALKHNLLISVDSLSQLEQLGQLQPGRVMLRFNPGIGAGHSKKVVTAGKETKFGINPDELPVVLELLVRYNLQLSGLNQHIGSLFMDGASYLDAAKVLLDLAADLLKQEVGRHIEIIDFGGGFGIPYQKYSGQARLDLAEFGRLLNTELLAWSKQHHYGGRFFIEPGRYIAAECGLVLGRVHSVKSNGNNIYVGTDIGFNVLLRPTYYDAFHDVEIYRDGGAPDGATVEQNIVGNICESGDILARNRPLPRLAKDDVIAMLDAGAYGYAMASNYNERLRPAEVLIGMDGKVRLIRRRETLDDLAAALVQF